MRSLADDRIRDRTDRRGNRRQAWRRSGLRAGRSNGRESPRSFPQLAKGRTRTNAAHAGDGGNVWRRRHLRSVLEHRRWDQVSSRALRYVQRIRCLSRPPTMLAKPASENMAVSHHFRKHWASSQRSSIASSDCPRGVCGTARRRLARHLRPTIPPLQPGVITTTQRRQWVGGVMHF